MKRSFQRGDASILVALIVAAIFLASAVVLSGILARQIPLTATIVLSEQALYAANSGLEEAFYRVSVVGNEFADVRDGVVAYTDGREATYMSCGQRGEEGVLEAKSEGVFRDEERRLARGAINCPAF